MFFPNILGVVSYMEHHRRRVDPRECGFVGLGDIVTESSGVDAFQRLDISERAGSDRGKSGRKDELYRHCVGEREITGRSRFRHQCVGVER